VYLAACKKENRRQKVINMFLKTSQPHKLRFNYRKGECSDDVLTCETRKRFRSRKIYYPYLYLVTVLRQLLRNEEKELKTSGKL